VTASLLCCHTRAGACLRTALLPQIPATGQHRNSSLCRGHAYFTFASDPCNRTAPRQLAVQRSHKAVPLCTPPPPHTRVLVAQLPTTGQHHGHQVRRAPATVRSSREHAAAVLGQLGSCARNRGCIGASPAFHAATSAFHPAAAAAAAAWLTCVWVDLDVCLHTPTHVHRMI